MLSVYVVNTYTEKAKRQEAMAVCTDRRKDVEPRSNQRGRDLLGSLVKPTHRRRQNNSHTGYFWTLLAHLLLAERKDVELLCEKQSKTQQFYNEQCLIHSADALWRRRSWGAISTPAIMAGNTVTK